MSAVQRREDTVKRTMIALTGAAMSVVGCGVLEPMPPEEVVAKKAQERVDLHMAGDYEGSYQFTTPGYRSTESVNRYATRWAGVRMWLSAQVENVQCGATLADTNSPERCEALLRVTYQTRETGRLSTTLSEDWILTEGDWYLYQKF